MTRLILLPLGNGTLQFDYDALGRVVKQTRTLDGTNYTVQRNYDTTGYLRGIQYPDGDIIGKFGATGTNLGYDQAGRLSTIPGILTSVTYNALGAPLVQTNVNGTTTTKTYDANRFWLKTIQTTKSSTTLQNLVYTLNDAGIATQVTSPFATEGWTYAYDELNRLTSSTNTGASTNNQTWTYDSLGRISNNSRIGNYTYGSSRPHAVTAAGSNTYAYDSNGNLTSGGGRTLTWNANNIITQVVMGSTTTTFAYGPDGDRIKKTAGSAVARYPFGDDYEINGTTVTKYFDAGFGVIAKKVGTTKYWLHTDRLGSINATTDSAGVQILRRSYRSYGELFGQTGTHTEKLGYIGERTDTETGLTYLHARYYDSSLGMFVSPDPIGADLNTYRYSSADPVNQSDPTGLATNCLPTNGDPGNYFDMQCFDVSDSTTVYANGAYSVHGYSGTFRGDGGAEAAALAAEQQRAIDERMACGPGDTRGHCPQPDPKKVLPVITGPDQQPGPASTPRPSSVQPGDIAVTAAVTLRGAIVLGRVITVGVYVNLSKLDVGQFQSRGSAVGRDLSVSAALGVTRSLPGQSLTVNYVSVAGGPIPSASVQFSNGRPAGFSVGPGFPRVPGGSADTTNTTTYGLRDLADDFAAAAAAVHEGVMSVLPCRLQGYSC